MHAHDVLHELTPIHHDVHPTGAKPNRTIIFLFTLHKHLPMTLLYSHQSQNHMRRTLGEYLRMMIGHMAKHSLLQYL